VGCGGGGMRTVLKFLGFFKRREGEDLVRELEKTVNEIACGEVEVSECVMKIRKAVEIAKELRRRINCGDVECIEAKAALDEFIQYLEWYLRYMRSLMILSAMFGDKHE
jgi:hypothetical protein